MEVRHGTDRPLHGHVAIITGGARGIGAAIVTELAARGASTAVLDRAAPQGTTHALHVQIDVADYKGVREAVHEIARKLGPPTVVVNNAGWDRVQPFLDNDPSLWHDLIAVNMLGVLNTTHVTLPLMQNNGGGRFVNVASDAGRVGSSGEAVYSACKGATIAFTKAIAREGARYGVLANCVCPGPTATPLMDEIRTDPAAERTMDAMVRATPLRKLAQPEDIAAAVRYFTEEPGHVTGQVLSVSGGLTMAG